MNTFNYNLFNTSLHATTNNLDHFRLLKTVYEKDLFNSENKKLLHKLINLTEDRSKLIKSQLYQDIFSGSLVHYLDQIIWQKKIWLKLCRIVQLSVEKKF